MKDLLGSDLVRKLGFFALSVLGIVILLQLLLALGVLPISMAWGGRHSQLTPTLRRASLGAILVLVGFMYVIARRSGLLGVSPPSLLIKIMSWLVTIYLAFNTLMNFLSSSPVERYTFGTLTLILVLTCFLISISNAPQVEDYGNQTQI